MSYRPSEIIIKPLKVEDFQEIFQLKGESIRVLNARDYTNEQIEALIGEEPREFSSEEAKTIEGVALSVDNFAAAIGISQESDAMVAWSGDRIVGYGRLYVEELSWVKSGNLYALFVHPECVRQGIGSKLLQTLENSSRKKDCQVVSLTASLTALPFYQACGYQVIKESTYVVGDVRIPVIIMEKWLVEPTEMAKIYWDASQEFNRGIGWVFSETLGLFSGR